MRLPEIALEKIIAHMSDARMAEHLPLLTFDWDPAAARRFVATKEAAWARDGLGHWAVLLDGEYAGWGGFQKEGDDWDFGLVLRPEHFGLGPRITRKALEFACADQRIPYVTFLLPPSRKKTAALDRMGAELIGPVTHAGAAFHKYRLWTPSKSRDRPRGQKLPPS